MKKFNEFLNEKLNETNEMMPSVSHHAYPETTVQKDGMGSLHMWKGNQNIVKVGTYLYKTKDGRDADVFVQNSDDVEAVLGNLNPEDREHVEKGFKLVTNEIPDEYFQN